MIFSRDKLAILKVLLRLKYETNKSVAFDVAPGELQFFHSVLVGILEARSDINVYLFYRYAGCTIQQLVLPGYEHRITHIERTDILIPLFVDLDLYITTEQFISGPPSVYTVTLFHGQPSKGLTFKLYDHDPLSCNDAFFLYGPLQRQALEEHLALVEKPLPNHLSLFDIGYTKSDRLLRREYNRELFLADLGLDVMKRTILYAPAFNEGASMRENGKDIVAALCSLQDHNIIAKLPIDCLIPGLVGGIDWYSLIGDLESRYSNFKMVRELEVDPSLDAADLLITCVSSVGFEFLALKKPVIFFDTPLFFDKTLPAYFPDWNVESWRNRNVVNGGREFGIVVSKLDELLVVIQEVLKDADLYPKRQVDLPGCLLYNPGQATKAAVVQIEKLLDLRIRSERPHATQTRWGAIRRWLFQKRE